MAKRMMVIMMSTMIGMPLCAQSIPLVYDVENTGRRYAEPLMLEPNQLPIIQELPDALENVSYGIGQKPAVEPHQVKARMEGDTALVVDVTINGQALTLRSVIRYPKVGQPPYALMIGTSMISLPKKLFEDRPIATMLFHESLVNDYSQWRKNHHDRGEHPFDMLYPHLKENGAYSEWAGGLSRLIDGLQQLGPEVTKMVSR